MGTFEQHLKICSHAAVEVVRNKITRSNQCSAIIAKKILISTWMM